MITIPVLVGFDRDNCIGTLTLDETKLPEEHTNYVFSLGYMAETAEKVTPVEFFGKYELIAVSLQTDKQYLAYLTQKQRSASVPVAQDTPNVFDGVRFPGGLPNNGDDSVMGAPLSVKQ
jgi:hypothetical protein